MAAMKGNLIGIRAIWVLIAMLIVIAGCDKELTEAEEAKILKKLSAQDLELIQATNNLSLNIIQAEYQQNKDKNFIFSPISVGMALGMISNGVGENEKYQIQQITGLESLIEKEINKSYNEFITFLQLNYDQSDVFCANSMWFSYGLNIDESYRTRVMAYYDAEISEINFTKKSSLQFINNWGSLKSGGQMSQLSSIAPSSNYNIYLVNAFSINTSWKNGRSFINRSNFTNSEGETMEVKSINLDHADIATVQSDDFEFIEIPLQGQNFLFSIVNPAEDILLDKLIENYSYNELFNQDGNLQTMRANVSIPDISFTSENKLKSTLGNIGLTDIFNSSLDLSPSFSTKTHGISEINQVAKFKIESQPSLDNNINFSNPELKSISINKPFLYFVRDKHTKSVIFAGYYSNPEE